MVQPRCKSITTLVFFLMTGVASAQAPKNNLVLKADAPERYVVVPGDTLWDISQHYTDSPWRWPELWGMNREQIRNPHLIYPGEVIVLDRARGTLSLAGEGRSSSRSIKLAPRIRSEAIGKEAIPSIPASAIEPFLTKPLLVEPDGLDRAPTIVATERDRVILSAGNVAYVRGLGNSLDESWYVYRRGNPLVDPETNKTLAYEAIYLGTAKVTRRGDPATVILTSAVREVNAGDKLVAIGAPHAINYAPHAPSVHMSGRVISIYEGLGNVGEAGPLQVVTINRGRTDGVEIGHVFALYSHGGTVHDVSQPDSNALIELPDERAGTMFIFRVFDRVSYGLIMQISRPIRPLDVVRTP